MATGDGTVYAEYKRSIYNSSNPDLGAGAVKLALMGSGYTPSTADAVWADISAKEASGTGYTAGGQAVSLDGPALNMSTGVVTFALASNPVTWAGLDVGTPSYAVLYDSVSGKLIAYYELGVASNGNDYSITFANNAVIVTN